MRARRVLARTLLLLAVLTVPALVFSVQLLALYRLEGIHLPVRAIVVLQVAHWYLWAAAGPVVWTLATRWPLVGPHRGAQIVRHIAAAIVVGAAVIAAYVAVYQALVRVPGMDALLGGRARTIADSARFFFTNFFPMELLVYGGVVAFAQATASAAQLRAREHDALRLESELATARLETLRTQLQPHFLFNTLHTIGSLILQQKTQAAVGMVAELGDLLRETLDRRHADAVPLRDEIAHLRRYVRIEEARFGDRLDVAWTIDPAADNALVPSFILQPVVENAFRHGVSKRTDTSRLAIRAWIDAASVVIEVYNDGPPLPDGWTIEAAAGFGLRNVADRLAARAGSSFTLSNAPPAGVRSRLALPLIAP